MSEHELLFDKTITGPYTIFVPTDAAFAKLGEDTINGYSNTQLKSILKYHIVDSYLLTPMVSGKKNYSTLLGEPLSVETSASVSITGGPLVSEPVEYPKSPDQGTYFGYSMATDIQWLNVDYNVRVANMMIYVATYISFTRILFP